MNRTFNKIVVVVGSVAVLLAWSLLQPQREIEQQDVVTIAPPTNVIEPSVSVEVVQPTNNETFAAALPESVAELADEFLDELINLSGSHNEMDDRLDAISSLGDSDDPKSTLALRSLLDDPATAIREEALESLALQGTPSSIEGITYGLSDPDGMVRQIAVELLIEDGSDAAIGMLALVSNDADVSLRRFTAEELALTDSASASHVLQLFLADADPVVRDIVRQH